jgi:hypothetical protein
MTQGEFCPNCGSRIQETGAFCTDCGEPLAEPEVPRAPAAVGAETVPEPAAASRAQPRVATSAQRQARAPLTTQPQQRPAPSSGAQPPGGPPPGPPRSPQPPTQDGAQPSGRRSRWAPLALAGLGVFLVAGVAIALLLAVGGSAGTSVKSASATRQQALEVLASSGTTTVSPAAPGLFAVVQTPSLYVTVPAGWRATAQSSGGVARAEFAESKQGGSTLVVVAEKGAGGQEVKRALAARRRTRQHQYAIGGFGRVTFPGGRQVWRLAYTQGPSMHETYFFSACGNRTGVVIDTSAPSASFAKLQGTLLVAASGTEPKC